MQFVGIFFFFLLGTLFGSFANVVLSRLPRGESLLFPRSRCDSCQKTLAWFDLIPIASFILLRGRCRYCQMLLSPTEPIVELLSGGLFIVSYLRFGWSFTSIGTGIFLVLLLIITILDLREKVIYTIFLPVGILLALIWTPFWQDPSSHLLGAAWGSALFCLIRISGTRIFRREAMGFGDVQLAGVLGFWVGTHHIYHLVAGSFVLGFLVAVPLLLTGNKKIADEIPFAPYLCAATALILMLY